MLRIGVFDSLVACLSSQGKCYWLMTFSSSEKGGVTPHAHPYTHILCSSEFGKWEAQWTAREEKLVKISVSSSSNRNIFGCSDCVHMRYFPGSVVLGSRFSSVSPSMVLCSYTFRAFSNYSLIFTKPGLYNLLRNGAATPACLLCRWKTYPHGSHFSKPHPCRVAISSPTTR